MERKVCFLLGAGSGEGDSCPKADSPPPPSPATVDSRGSRAVIGGGRGPRGSSAGSSDRHLEAGHAVLWPASS